MRITGCAEPIVGASCDVVSFIAHYAGRVAVPGRDRANDSAGAVADVILPQHGLPPAAVYRAHPQIGHSQVIAAQGVASGHSVFLLCILQAGDTLTIPELMEEQRARMRSSVPAERLAAALLMPGLLRDRLRELDDFGLGQILDFEVCSNLSVFGPKLTVCMEVAERLSRHREDKSIQRTRSTGIKRDEGEHILRAESALFRGRIPHLLLPFQRDRFASNAFMVPSMAVATHCLCQAGFRESPRSPSLLIDRETRRLIRVVEHV